MTVIHYATVLLLHISSSVTLGSMETATRKMTANEAVGAKINQLMFRDRVSRKQLAEILGIKGATVSRKIYGQNSWTLEELFDTADYFGVTVADLLPRRTKMAPGENSGGQIVAGAGFEPTTSGL